MEIRECDGGEWGREGERLHWGHTHFWHYADTHRRMGGCLGPPPGHKS